MFTSAALYRAYNEPFYLAEKEGRTECLQKFKNGPASIEDDDVEYLRQFPVYSFDTEAMTETEKCTWRECDKIFGFLADWLVKDGRTRRVEEGLCEDYSDESDDLSDDPTDAERPSQSFDSAILGVLREMAILVAAYQCFPGNLVGQHGRSEEKWKLAHSKRANQDVRKVSVIMFGHFRVDETSMPAVSSNARLWLSAKPLPLVTSGTASSIDIARIIRVLQWNSTRPDLHDGYPTTLLCLIYSITPFAKSSIRNSNITCSRTGLVAIIRMKSRVALFSAVWR